MHKSFSKKEVVKDLYKAKDWESDDYTYHRIAIGDYLYKINDGTCFFCKMNIARGSSNEQIEHIVNKKDYPEFAYQPKNLTMACSKCNSNKSVKETLVPSKALKNHYTFKDYPLNSLDYLIIHPYFDEYNDHINIKYGCLYLAKNNSFKGNKVIEMCNLTRLQLLEDNAKSYLNDPRCESNIAKRAAMETYGDEETVKKNVDILLMLSSNKSLDVFVNDIYKNQNLRDNQIITRLEFFNRRNTEYFCAIIERIRNIKTQNLLQLKKFLLRKSLLSEFITKISKVVHIIQTLLLIFKKKEFRENLKFVIDIDYSLYNKAISQIGCIKDLNPQLIILSHIGELMRMSKFYDKDYIESQLKIDYDKANLILDFMKST